MKKLLLLAFLLLPGIPVFGAEQIELTTPFDPDDRTFDNLKPCKLVLDKSSRYISVELCGDTSEIVFQHAYHGTEAIHLMKVLNKADLTTNSLDKRIMNKLINDGVLSGTISGTPD